MAETVMSNSTQQIESQKSLPQEPKEGKLEIKDKSYSFIHFENTEEITADTFEFIQMHEPLLDENGSLNFEAFFFNQEMIETYSLFQSLLSDLQTPEEKLESSETPMDSSSKNAENTQSKSRFEANQKVPSSLGKQESQKAQPEPKVFDSVFSLAKMMSSTKTKKRCQNKVISLFLKMTKGLFPC